MDHSTPTKLWLTTKCSQTSVMPTTALQVRTPQPKSPVTVRYMLQTGLMNILDLYIFINICNLVTICTCSKCSRLSRFKFTDDLCNARLMGEKKVTSNILVYIYNEEWVGFYPFWYNGWDAHNKLVMESIYVC